MMKKWVSLFLAALLACSVFVGAVGCQKDEGTFEKAGKKVDKAVDETKDKAKDVGDKAEDKAEDLKNKAENSMEKK